MAKQSNIWAVTNQKGGSCKTTTAVNLSAALGECGRKVLVVDLDPQASASSWLGVKDGGPGLLDVFTENRSIISLATASSAPGVDLVPASSWLFNLEKVLAGEVGTELILRNAMADLPEKWDFIFLDCPPSLSLITVSALTAAGRVLVPVESSVMALSGLAALFRTIEVVRDRLNPNLEFSAILSCRVNRTRISQEVVANLQERFGDLVFQAVIRENTRLKEAPSFGQPITIYDTRSSGALDYRYAAAELIAKEG